jgi:hypothetical protein
MGLFGNAFVAGLVTLVAIGLNPDQLSPYRFSISGTKETELVWRVLAACAAIAALDLIDLTFSN